MKKLGNLKSAVAAILVGAFLPIVASAQPSADQQPGVQEQAITIPARPGIWGDIVYGSADAPIELIEYGSLTCPACANFAATAVPRLLEDFVNSGQLKFVFRNFVRDRYDLAAASASRCVATEADAKAALDDLFKQQKTWLGSDNPYQAMADIMGRYGMTQDEMGQCISDQDVQRHIIEMRQYGQEQFEVSATPTLVLDGVPMSFPGYDRLKLRIETLISTKELTAN